MNKINAQHNRVLLGQSYTLLTLGTFLFLAIFLFSIDFVPELKTNALEQDTSTISPNVSIVTEKTTQEELVSDEALQNDDISEEYVYTGTVVHDSQEYTESHSSPKRIVIRSIGVDTTVKTPRSTDIEVLDTALLEGAVHYPGSGNLGEDANVLIFGHSSYLPVIHNQAYKAFNELSKLDSGDEIVVYSDNYKYIYSVDKVWLSQAENVQVHFDANEPLLTLATCNTFGAKQDRWIVTASLESKRKIN